MPRPPADPAAQVAAAASSSRAPAVNRAIAILRVLLASKTPMSVNGLARTLELAPSTCFHLLRALEQEGFVNMDPADKRYRIGVGLVAMARGALDGAMPVELLRQETERLATRFDVTSIATQVERGERMLILAVARAHSPFAVHFEVGRRFPAFVSATGRCFAAQAGLSPAQLRDRFDALAWGKAPTFEAWLADVQRAKEEGIALDIGNYVRGYTIVAVPILEDGRMVRSLVAVNLSERMSSASLRALQREMRAAGARLSS